MEFTEKDREAFLKFYTLLDNPSVRPEYTPYFVAALEHGKKAARFFRGDWDDPVNWRDVFRRHGCE